MTTTATATFTYSHTVGFLAYRGRGFIHPVDLTLGDNGVMYVLNRGGAESVTRWTSSGSASVRQTKGTSGNGEPAAPRWPVLVAVGHRPDR